MNFNVKETLLQQIVTQTKQNRISIFEFIEAVQVHMTVLCLNFCIVLCIYRRESKVILKRNFKVIFIFCDLKNKNTQYLLYLTLVFINPQQVG